MPGRFDDALKQLTELSPEDWVVRGGWTAAPATLIDADIATISGAADKVISVVGNPNWLLAIDFQAGHDTVAKLPDLLLYNSALFKRHRLLVRSLLVLLQPGADSPQLTGLYERGFSGEASDVSLRYQTVRVWQVPAEKWLTGGLGLVPLAPLGDLRGEDLLAVIARMKQRVGKDVPPGDSADFWAAALILMGVRYDRSFIETLLKGVGNMKESVTYMAILEEGEAKGLTKGRAEGEAKGATTEARKILLILGRDKFGEPPTDVQDALNAMNAVDPLNDLIMRLKLASGWHELLGMPSPRRRSTRRKPGS